MESSKNRMSRRDLLAGAAGAVVASAADRLTPPKLLAQTSAAQSPTVDPTTVPGRPASVLGDRSAFESPARTPSNVASRTPLQDLSGTITPADLHFERHHAGIPAIDPSTWELVIHGMVDRPRALSLGDLKRFPQMSRICFLECSGNGSRGAPAEATAQQLAGLTSQSEWTGVPLRLLLEEVGIGPDAAWLIAEGMDAARLSRSVPLTKALDDAMVVYAQNGEALRPAQGYPVRLFLPGWEGNTSVKWLRRIELTAEPSMSREETSKYTEVIRGGVARQFSFAMDSRSIITSPSYPLKLVPGWNEIRGIAWSGRGRISKVDLSLDGGRSWVGSDLQGPVLPKAHTRFRYLWNWDGRETSIVSRATDETGYVQPSDRELLAARGGRPPGYHYNAMEVWRISADGAVTHDREVMG